MVRNRDWVFDAWQHQRINFDDLYAAANEYGMCCFDSIYTLDGIQGYIDSTWYDLLYDPENFEYVSEDIICMRDDVSSGCQYYDTEEAIGDWGFDIDQENIVNYFFDAFISEMDRLGFWDEENPNEVKNVSHNQGINPENEIDVDEFLFI